MAGGEALREITLLLLLAAGVGAVTVWLRQPLIVGFIAVGIVAGPAGLELVEASETIGLLARLGVALLLFVVGLKLDVGLIRTTGRVALITGLGQVVFTSAIGYAIALALGLSPVAALYVAVALTFSSTIIIVKLLSDKREIDDLHGRIAVGFLIVQDIVVILAMIALTAFGGADPDVEPLREVLGIFLRGVLFLVGIALLMRYVLPSLIHAVARTSEMLVLFAVAWAVALAAAGEQLGFSEEIGAFLAGVSLASTPYREAIGARLVGLRDFLLLFFFVALGAQIELTHIGAQVGRALVLSLFVLVGNPLIVMVLMGLMGYRARVSFMSGLAVAQISEFSLILAGMGLTLGFITSETVSLITLVGLITIGLSTYLILYSQPIYERLAPWLGVFEREVDPRPWATDESPASPPQPIEVIVFGLGRYGGSIARRLARGGWNVLGVDFDPQKIAAWQEQGGLAYYGDTEDPEMPGYLPLSQVQWVISTVPPRHANVTLLDALEQHHYHGWVAVIAHNPHDEEILREAGADEILRPYVDAAVKVVRTLEEQRAART